jgi:SAM-dependent methyltransferase
MNSEEQRAHWDLKYEQGLTSLTQPDPFFISAYGQFVDQSFPNAGVALDLACGLGRHALWLASRHWRVSGVDLSDVAIRKLSQAALELNVNLDLFVGDAAEYKFEPARFDLIVLFYHLDRNLFPKMVSALKPSGLLISKMSLQWDLDGRLTAVSANPMGRNELASLCSRAACSISGGTTGTWSGRCRVHRKEVRRCALKTTPDLRSTLTWR